MTQLNQSTWNCYVQLVTIDLTPWGDQVYGFIDSSTYSAALPELSGVTWQGQYFAPVPFNTSGWQRGGDNLGQRPKISLPDFGADMYVTLASHNLAAGATINRYQALGDDILVNDPHAPFAQEVYLLNSVTFDGHVLEVELATHLDFQRAKVPRHVMTRTEYPGLGANTAR